VLLAVLVACGDNSSSVVVPADCPGDPVMCRASCGYGSGDLAEGTLADFAVPMGSAMPIDHIVLVMQENRTFDHYFSSLTVPGQTVDGASPSATNPDPTHPEGGAISRFHQTLACFDNPAESWDEVHREIDGSALDGFTTQNALSDPTNDPTGARSMGYYDETDLPYYYALARQFAISDRHFSSAQANTWTNRVFYMAGTAYGITSNVFPPTMDGSGNPLPDMFTRLNDAGIDWTFYAQDFPTLAILSGTWAKNLNHVHDYADFFSDAAAGTLAPVVFVEATDMSGGASPDEDPPADFQLGQAFVANIVNSVTTSPLWPHTAMFLSYDEQGGLYDHVPPPPACVPDDFAPQLGSGDVVAGYDAYGLRVPLIVISPYAKRGYVSHVVTDHTSILRFVEARFGLPALTHRDANAVPPFDMFDFDAAPDTSVPNLPAAPVDSATEAACKAMYPGMNEGSGSD
jgi:phospholipase C